MKLIKTDIPDLLIIEPNVFQDERGYFFESYNKNKYAEQNINIEFVQDNQSKSGYGVIRGLHYQLNPNAQTKLVRVLQGAIWDVAVDIRKGSQTYGKWFGIELSAENKYQLLVPQGFAHGFSVLTDETIVYYKCDDYYSPQNERGIIYNDSQLNVDWKIPASKAVLSAKDIKHPSFREADNNFIYLK
ncbi:MAG: dTDP-4-dehydrorhamnose 3,5-epimerase [Bacteroidetes bacterium]|nr:dTDP-4-dehydrorhamnose 3,5-epimerase [Bacteroidales bacterium]NJO68780.1 dTDP-4-dehydrorhamnose 3,5-epimerase [Bacteroidota bacterium]